MTTANDLLLRLFVPIQKVDEENRLVYGTVAAEVEDNAGEVFDYEGSKPYFEAWTKNAEATSNGLSKGNLRVMHGPKVAGKLTDIDFNDATKMISCVAHVVDDDEWKKVSTGCYTGFSMGGRYMSKLKKNDTGPTYYIANPVEVSLVDKPCIKTAVFDYCKADGTTEQHHFDGNLLIDHATPIFEVISKADEGDVVYEGELEDLFKADWDEDAHERDEKGRFAGGGGGGLSDSDKERATSWGGKEAKAWKARLDSDWKKGGPNSPESHPHVQGAANKQESYRRAADGIRTLRDMHQRDPITVAGMTHAAEVMDKHGGSDPTGHGSDNAKASVSKSDTGEVTMYIPTNDEMLPVAKSLAKADGKSENDWLGYMEPAREQLVAEKAASAADGKDQTDKTTGDTGFAARMAADKAKDGSSKTEANAKAGNGNGKDDHQHGDVSATDAKPGSGGAPNPSDAKGATNKTQTADKSKIDDKDSKTKGKFPFAKKADGTPSQVWVADDGEGFLAKADCIAHNEELAKAAPASPLLGALADLGALIKSDDADTKGKPWGKHDADNADCKCKDCTSAAEKADVANATFTTLRSDLTAAVAKFAVFRDNELTKGMYTVSRLAQLMEALESLHMSVCWEEQAEGDGSSLPAALLEGLKGLGQTLVAMATEEVNEMIAGGGKMTEDSPIMALAASTLGLEKADFATAIGERLEKRDLGARAGDPDLLAKFDVMAGENAALKAEIETAVPLIKSLFDEVQAIKALPRPPAPNPRVVEKGDDGHGSGGGRGNGADLLAKFDPSDLADAAIRMSQSSGGRFVVATHGARS